jgi:hypothetical protein
LLVVGLFKLVAPWNCTNGSPFPGPNEMLSRFVFLYQMAEPSPVLAAK